MGLKVWLPLDSDLRNLGTYDEDIQTMGSGITWTAGKIGKAATFPNSCASCIHMPGLKLQIFSWAAWFKVLGEGAGTSQRMLSEGRDTGSVGTNIWVSKAGTTLNWSTHKKSGQTAIELNRWYHVILTADGTNIKLYLDGILKSTTPYTEDSDYAQSDNQFVLGKMSYAYANTGNYFPFNGQLNDVRIYDHCLSAAEVHEIAQGLVLHYKLDGGIYGNPNLVDGSNTASTSTNTWNFNMQVGDKTNTIEYEDGIPIVVITRGTTEQSGWCFLSYNNLRRNEIKTSTTYTVSFDIKSVQAGTISFTGFLQSNATNYMTNSTTVIQGVVNANSWSHIVLQCTTKSSFSDITIGSQIVYMSPSTSLRATGNIMKFKNIKVEEGTIETVWCPSNSEGIDRSNIEDSSGYNHNGEVVGTITFDSDSPRYNCSSVFDGSSYIAVGSQLYGMRDAMTVNLWCKKDWTQNTGTPFSSVQSGGFGWQCSGTNYVFYCGTGETSNSYANRTLALSGLSEGWHMLSATYDGFSLTTYIDGELINTVKKHSTKTSLYYNWNSGMFIGAESSGQLMTSGTDRFIGNISDVRVYCTPLLDTDIKQLYNVGMKVDNLGGVHSFELEESGNNRITKTGILEGNLMGESEFSHYLKYDSNIYIEPDGSAWVKIYHHNNPKGGSFSSTNDFVNGVYIDENRWFNVNVCNYIDKWELMVKGKYTAEDNEWKIRWIQDVNPMTATFAEVAVANITKITNSGGELYGSSPSAWGGLYAKKGSAYLTANNGTNGNWWGAVGSYSVYQNGIPGWGTSGTITTTGFNDLYVRIDNVDFNTVNASNTKNKVWNASTFIEM